MTSDSHKINKGRRYPLKGLEEHTVVDEFIAPLIESLPDNVKQIIYYGATEMLNNAIDHSEGTSVTVIVEVDVQRVLIIISDDGVGIFNKIQKSFHLENPEDSIIELCKGKLTTDPTRHTGEGIFFTSRVCDGFLIHSGILLFAYEQDIDMLLNGANEINEGTMVSLEVNKDTKRMLAEVFDKFTSGEEEFGFTRTHFPVKVAEYGPDKLMSRSIAKRVLNRFSQFKEVMLDFKDVEFIGQAFADEIFRVYAKSHPEVHILPINAVPAVQKMINRAQANRTGENSEEAGNGESLKSE